MTPQVAETCLKLSRKELAGLLALCLALISAAAPAILENSYVFNENGRLASGVMKLRRGDFSSFRVNPPLVHAIAALPSLLVPGAYCPGDEDFTRVPFGRTEYEAGDAFVRKTPDHRLFLRLGRFFCAAFSLLGIFACYYYARFLYGSFAGFTAAVLWTFSPYVLGYGSTIGSDAPAAALAVAVVGLFHARLRSRDPNSLASVGVVMGIAQLCKFTLLALYPLLVAFWLFVRLERPKNSEPKRRLKFGALCQFIGVSLIVLNLGYLFDGTFTPLGDYSFRSLLLTGKTSLDDVPHEGANRFADSFVGKTPLPVPKDYALGIDAQRFDFERGLRSYCRGQWSRRGRFDYYVYALAVKTPLGVFGLLGLAVLSFLFVKSRRTRLDEGLVWTAGALFLLFVSSQRGFSVHSRYVMPALPFFFVAAGRTALFARQIVSERVRRAITSLHVILLVCVVLSVLAALPDEIAYFNALAPSLAGKGRQAERPEREGSGLFPLWQDARGAIDAAAPLCLLDSNLDWGQDAYRFAEWLAARGDVSEIRVRLQSNGETLVRALDPRCKRDDGTRRNGWIAVSAQFLYGWTGAYDWLKSQKPIAIVGKTIYVYKIDSCDPDLNQVRSVTL